jgi:YebC/PmpR family DNA-binding regulatory protein
MPKDTIERAIARGAGASDEGELSEITYEAFGPGGVGLMVEAVTDNTNRTAANVKHIVGKHGGNLGGPGSVAWQFERKGVVRISFEADDTLELELIEAGAEDMKKEEGGTTIQVPVEELKNILEALTAKSMTPEYSGLEWVPKQTVEIDDATRGKIEALAEALEEDEDVGSVFTNDV